MGSQKNDTDAKLPLIYGKTVLSLENILLPPEKLERSPSVIDGLDTETEYDLRIVGCELIQTAGILLRLPQVAMATGQVLFQRFYFCKSFVRHAMEVTAMGCIYLASKIEEAPRRIRDVMNVFHHIRQVRCQKEIAPLILDQQYINVKTQVIKAERRILKELGFCVHVKHPHKLIVCYLQVLMLEKNKAALQTAWNYINDSLRTDVFLQHSPETVACACIYLTARKLKIALPKNPSWFSLFNVKEEEIVEVCRKIVNLYNRPKIDPEILESKVEELKRKYEKLRSTNVNNVVSGNNTPNSNASQHKSPSPPPKNRKIDLTPKKSPRRNSDSSPKKIREKDRDSCDSIDSSPRKNRDRERDKERKRDRDSRSKKDRDYRSSRRDRDYRSSKKDRRRDVWWSPSNSKIRI